MRDEPAEFRLRDVALTAYGPTVVSSTGYGAVTPLLALRARDLGADVSAAALVVALLGIGMILTSLPAGALVARIGERRALAGAGVVDAGAMTLAALTDSLVPLGLAVLVSGATWTTFLMCRQGFMIDAVPLSHRARALSTLGGMHRTGIMVGPLIGAAVVHLGGLPAVFAMAALLSLAAAALALLMPDLGAESRLAERAEGHLGVWEVLRAHRRSLSTLGMAVVVIAVSRSMRNGLLPLWADHIGLSASTTSLIFGLAGAVDVVFFFPGGWLMDRRGRFVVAVPVVLSVAVGVLLLPLARDALAVAGVMALVAVGNGLGAGIVMTLGADAAPVRGRAQFLGGWRLCGDLGTTGGPLLVGLVAVVAPLSAVCLVIGGLGLLGTLWVGYWTRQEDTRLRAVLSRSSP